MHLGAFSFLGVCFQNADLDIFTCKLVLNIYKQTHTKAENKKMHHQIDCSKNFFAVASPHRPRLAGPFTAPSSETSGIPACDPSNLSSGTRGRKNALDSTE